jgi:hypothetical protein
MKTARTYIKGSITSFEFDRSRDPVGEVLAEYHRYELENMIEPAAIAVDPITWAHIDAIRAPRLGQFPEASHPPLLVVDVPTTLVAAVPVDVDRHGIAALRMSEKAEPRGR